MSGASASRACSVARPFEALREVRGGLHRTGHPVGPGADFRPDRLAAAAAHLGLVDERLQGPARIRRRRAASRRHERSLPEKLGLEIRRRRQIAQGRPRFFEARLRLRFAGDEPSEALLEGGPARRGLRFAPLGGGEPRPQGDREPGGPGGPPRGPELSREEAARTEATAASAAARRLSTWRRASPASRSRSPRRFFSASRRAAADGRLGRGGEAVPAPQVALARDQPLAGPEQRAQARAVGPRDDAGLPQPPEQGRRSLGDLGEGDGAVRKRRIARAVVGLRPVGRRGGVRRRVEILAERGAQRGLEAPLDRDLVERRRPEVPGGTGEELGQRPGLGLEALRLALGLVERLARAGFGIARGGERRAGGGCGLLGALGGGARRRDLLAQTVRGGVFAGRREKRFEVALDPGPLRGEAAGAIGFVAHRAFEGGAAGVDVGQLGLESAERRFRSGKLRLRGVDPGLRLLALRLRALRGVRDLGLLGVQPGHGGFGIGALGGLAGDVAIEVRGVALELGEAFPGASLLGLERRAGVRETLESRRRGGLGLPQARERVRGDRLRGGGPGLLLRALGDGPQVLRGLALRLRGLLAGVRKRDRQLQRFEAADLRRKSLVSRGLPALLLERLDLRRELAQHVLDPHEVVLRGLEPQLGLVPAGMEAGDSRRVLEDPAARLGLGRDEFVDLALAHHRRRAGARGGVGEEDLHVAGAHLAPVDPIRGAFLALDPARDLQPLRVVERRGRRPVVVLDREHHLGAVARRTASRAREDDVVHPGGAHVLVGVLPHDPAQRLDEVRLAAAVRPDDPGQPRLNQDVRRLHERLEADDAQAGQFHGATTTMPLPAPRSAVDDRGGR